MGAAVVAYILQAEYTRQHGPRTRVQRPRTRDPVQELETIPEVDTHALLQTLGAEDPTPEVQAAVQQAEAAGEVAPASVEEEVVPCARPPNPDKTCAGGFDYQPSTDCCVLPRESNPSVAGALGALAAETAFTEGIKTGIRAAANPTATRHALRNAVRVARGLGRTGAVVGGRAATTATANGVKSARLGLGLAKLNFASAKAAVYANPVGLAMLAFDVFNMILDSQDVEGYNNFTDNRMIERAMDQIHYSMQTVAKEYQMDYPLIFPLDQAFPDIWGTQVFEALYDQAEDEVLDALSDEDITLLTAAIENQEDVPAAVSGQMEKLYDKFINDDPRARDRLIYETLKTVPEIDNRHIALYPDLSTKTRYGVSLSKEGVLWWNMKHRETWYKYHDIFGNAQEPPPEFVDPPVATWTPYYYEVDEDNPGTDMKPNMLRKQVNKKATPVPLFLMGGQVVSYCEKPRDVTKKPKDYKPCVGHEDKLCRPKDCAANPECYDHTTEKKCTDSKECKWTGLSKDALDPRKYMVHFDDGTSRLGSVGCGVHGRLLHAHGYEASLQQQHEKVRLLDRRWPSGR